jgi:ribosomal protein S18 acetylase RimI-like enzyme
MIETRLLGPGDAHVLENVADDVFDHAVDRKLADEFLRDPRHHIIVAVDGGQVVGMVTSLHYVHPDKPPQLFVNELGVAGSHRRRGIGRRLIQEMLEHAASLGCAEAWVGTENDNVAARALYESISGPGEQFVLYELAVPQIRTKGTP